jgi:hypothetical protein
MKQLLLQFCAQCGAALVRTKSGAVCPQGHGRIVPLQVDSRSGPWPEARRVDGTRRYRLHGYQGEWATAVSRPVHRDWLARRNARMFADVRNDSWIIGRWRRSLIWFRPVEGTDNKLGC